VDHASFSLGDSTPVVMAASCLTGNYEGSANDHGIAEAFLNKGAGVYIGSTEISYSSPNNAAFRRFSERWDEWESAGVVLNYVKRAIWGKDGWYEYFSYWAWEYNLYGDPKHGMLEGVWTPPLTREAQGVDSMEEVNGQTKLGVTVPDPVFHRVDGGGHEVEIPGGLTLVEYGAYEVPIWTVSIPYRPGTRVTGVNLASRGEPVAYDELDLPEVDMSITSMPGSNQVMSATVTGWYPVLDQLYDWSVEQQSDGSSVLEIVIYPFYYNSDNGDALFYQKHFFTVETITTDVEITELSMETHTWQQGDMVWGNLVVENTGVMTDVVVQASIRDMTGDLVDGLPLMSLNDLTGVGVLDLYWDSDRNPWGHYNLMVELRDLQGNVLDTALDDFQLGFVEGGVSKLEASQLVYDGGESIQLSMTFVNSGTVRLDGVAVIEVLGTDALTTTYRITGTIDSLAPGASVEISGWLDTSMLDAQYEVVAHAYYFSQVSEAKQLVLTRRTRVYLPLVISD